MTTEDSGGFLSGTLGSVRGVFSRGGSGDDPDSAAQSDTDESPPPDGESVENGGLVVDKVGELHNGYVAPNSVREQKNYVETDEEFTRTYYIKKWPRDVWEMFLEKGVNTPEVDFDLSLHLDPRDSQAAQKELQSLYVNLRAQENEQAGNADLSSQDLKQSRESVEMMKDKLSQEGAKLYDVSGYITVRAGVQTTREEDQDPGLDQLDSESQKLVSLLKRYSQTAVQQAKYQQLSGLQSTEPMGRDAMGKRKAMLGDAVSTMFPFTSSQVIEPSGVNIGQSAINDTPIIMDQFDRENGYNALRVGMVGSGKSFAAKQYLLRLAMSESDLNIFVIDPMGGFLGVNEALNGDWIQVEGSETVNPLEIEETPQHVIENSQVDPWKNKLKDVRFFLDQFFQIRGEPLGKKEQAVLMRAVKMAYAANGITPDVETHSKQSPTMVGVVEAIRLIQKNPEEHTGATTSVAEDDWKEVASELEIGLEPFRSDGEYANLSGQTDLTLGTNQMTYIDISQISARGGESLMMSILFSMVYQQVKQSEKKTVLMIDEAHKILQDANNLDFFEEVFRHSRHYDLSIQLISQTLEEFFVNKSSSAIADQCVVKYIHRIPGLNRELAAEELGLNSKHMEFVETSVSGDGDKDYSECLVDISDVGKLPLRVRASRNEAAVIDYDPDESWENMTEPESERIKRALDRSLRTRSKYNQPHDDLADTVEDVIVEQKKREARAKLTEQRPTQTQTDTETPPEPTQTETDTDTETPPEPTQTETDTETPSESPEQTAVGDGGESVSPGLQDVDGVGDTFEEKLEDAGIHTVAELANSDIDSVVDSTGISKKRMAKLVIAAEQMAGGE